MKHEVLGMKTLYAKRFFNVEYDLLDASYAAGVGRTKLKPWNLL